MNAGLQARLGARFKIKDMGDVSQLLGMHITGDKLAALFIWINRST
jgi:hypothetical protein